MIDQYDDVREIASRYDDVVHRIAREHRIRRATARRWFEEMVRFLDLCHASPGALSPSKKVDKAWHEFIMFTREYAAFCEGRYGRFIHHDPYEAASPGKYQETLEAYSVRYGKPPARIWPAGRWDGGVAGGGCGSAHADGGSDGGGSGCGGGGCGGGG